MPANSMAVANGRRPDWRTRLHNELAASMTRPFEWGMNDCALFAMRCVEAMTGDNPAAPYAGAYKTARGAMGVIRRAGHTDLVEFAAAHFAAIHPSKANVGDVAAVQTERGPALGVFGGSRIHVMRHDGLGTVPRNAAISAYRI